MNEIEDKEKIIKEIRLTIKYLLREKEKGRESFDNSDFFDRDLEEEIIGNFDYKIGIPEYEELVYNVFGAKTRGGTKITEGRVHKEVRKLIRQYRIRSKKKILQRLAAIFHPLPSQVELLRDLMNTSYDNVMQEPLRIKITSLVRDGIRDFRRIMSVLRRENYEVNKDIIENIYHKTIADLEKSKAKYSRSPIVRGKSNKLKIELDYAPDKDSPLKRRLREQMRKTLTRKARFKKQRFIKKECPKFRFKQESSNFVDNNRVLVFSGQTDYATLSVKTVLSSNRIITMEVSCRRHDLAQGAVIDITQLQKIATADQRSSFLQRWLKNAVKHAKYESIPEVMWFIMSVLNSKFGLPPEVSAYLKRNFIGHVTELDKTLEKNLIEKALEQV